MVWFKFGLLIVCMLCVCYVDVRVWVVLYQRCYVLKGILFYCKIFSFKLVFELVYIFVVIFDIVI